MKYRKTKFLCPKCEMQLNIYDDRKNKAILYCDKCDKFFEYEGPKEMEVQTGVSEKEVVRFCSRFIKELS